MAISQWLKGFAKPVAIVLFTDERTQQVSVAASIAKLIVPYQLIVPLIDNEAFFCKLCSPFLSCKENSVQQWGYTAAIILTEMI